MRSRSVSLQEISEVSRGHSMLDQQGLWLACQALGRSVGPWLARASGVLGVGSVVLLLLYLMIAMILLMLVGLGIT